MLDCIHFYLEFGKLKIITYHHSKTRLWYSTIPTAATITPSTTNVFTTQTTAIKCILTELLDETNTQWTTSANVPDLGLNPSDGSIQDKTQQSILPLSSVQLVKLKTAGANDPVFTCKIVVGDENTEFTATQTINIYDPGRLNL